MPDRLLKNVNTLTHLAALMFVVVVGALVLLTMADKDTEELRRIAGPLLTAVIITGVLGQTTKTTNDRLDHIEKQQSVDADRLEELADPGEDYSPRYAAGPERAAEDGRRATARVNPSDPHATHGEEWDG